MISNDALQQLLLLLLHEAVEMGSRLDDGTLPDPNRIAFEHKRRAFCLVAGWVVDLQLSARPGCGGYSRAARDFHDYGKPFPVLEAERFSAQGFEISKNGVPRIQFDPIEQFEGNEVAGFHLRGEPPSAAVGKNDDSFHEASMQKMMFRPDVFGDDPQPATQQEAA